MNDRRVCREGVLYQGMKSLQVGLEYLKEVGQSVSPACKPRPDPVAKPIFVNLIAA